MAVNYSSLNANFKDILLKKEVICKKSIVRLKDIIRAEVKLSEVEQNLYVTTFSPKSKDRVLTAKFLNDKFSRLNLDLSIEKNQSVLLKNKFLVLSRDEIKTKVNDAFSRLKKKFTAENKDFVYNLNYKSLLEPLRYPAREKVNIYIEERPRIRLSGNQLFRLIIELDGIVFWKLYINTYIDVSANVYKVKEKLRIKEHISFTKFKKVREDVTGIENAIVTSNFNFENHLLKQNLYPGTTLLKKHFKKKPDITRGDIVTMQINAGSVMLEVPVVALSDSYSGRRSRFRSKDMRKTYTCFVENSTKVIFKR